MKHVLLPFFLLWSTVYGSDSSTPCEEGGCQYESHGTSCWSVHCDCQVGNHSYALSFIGEPQPISANVLTCDACNSSESGHQEYALQQETGISFCASLGIGVGWQTGCSAAGFSFQNDHSGSSNLQWCVNTKEVWVHKRTGKRRTVTYFL